MELSHATLVLFTICSGLRIFSYLPQIYRVATDRNGASAIAYSTWTLWIAANIATALYATVNLRDWYLTSVSIVYATCCLVVIALTFVKRRRHRSGASPSQTPRAQLSRRHVARRRCMGSPTRRFDAAASCDTCRRINREAA